MTIEHLLTSDTITTRSFDPNGKSTKTPKENERKEEDNKSRQIRDNRKKNLKHNPKEGAHNRDDLLSPTRNTRRKEGKRRKQYLPTKETNKKDDQYRCKTRSRTTITGVEEGTARNSKTLISSFRIQR
jgi:hypothetical protein